MRRASGGNIISGLIRSNNQPKVVGGEGCAVDGDLKRREERDGKADDGMWGKRTNCFILFIFFFFVHCFFCVHKKNQKNKRTFVLFCFFCVHKY